MHGFKGQFNSFEGTHFLFIRNIWKLFYKDLFYTTRDLKSKKNGCLMSKKPVETWVSQKRTRSSHFWTNLKRTERHGIPSRNIFRHIEKWGVTLLAFVLKFFGTEDSETFNDWLTSGKMGEKSEKAIADERLYCQKLKKSLLTTEKEEDPRTKKWKF